MKAKNLIAAVAGLVLLAGNVYAQNPPVAPSLAYGVPQVLQLAKAKVSDDTIVAYVRNSGNSYGLDADQIIYLHQQGVSDNVLTAMLGQPKPASMPAPSAPQPDNSYPAPAPAVSSYPAPAYAQTAPSSSVYVMPNSQPDYSTYTYYSQPYYYYPYYYPYCYRPFYSRCYARPCSFGSFSFAVGGGFHGVSFAGRFHGGTSFHSSSGFNGGGGFHGGFHR